VSSIKQITIKAIGCEPKQAVNKGVKVFLCRIFGEASGHKTKEGKNGDAYALLMGAFRAVRPAPIQTTLPGMEVPPAETVEFDSDILLLPGGMEDHILSPLKANKGKAIQFCFDISAVPDSSVAIGFSYTAAVVIAPAISDHVKALATALAAVPTPGASPAPAPGPNQDLPPVAQMAKGYGKDGKRTGGKKSATGK
jgi:hypothetical protein